MRMHEMRVCGWLLGGEVLEQLCRDPQFQQYLHYIDRLAPHGEVRCGGSGSGDADIEMTAQQQLSRINRDVQRRVKRVQDDETAFRLLYVAYKCDCLYLC